MNERSGRWKTASVQAGRLPSNRVILWPDTFNNYFHPQVAEAAVEVMEAAGFEVAVPKRNLCCGRPLYDWGMLDDARELLVDVLETLREDIENGTPVVVLEPSCASVFQGRALNFFPRNENAKRLAAQTYLLSNLLEQKAADFELPRIEQESARPRPLPSQIDLQDGRRGGRAETSRYRLPDARDRLLRYGGCVRVRAQHYDVSIKCGERVSAARGQINGRGRIDNNGRLQLPRTNNPNDRAAAFAPGRSAAKSTASINSIKRGK